MTRRLLLLALALVPLACGRERPVAADRPPVIIISVDTLRADHLPVYGYLGVKTPAVDALAKDGVVFENAYAHVPLTLPSHLSLLTGTHPAAHAVRDNLGYRFDAAAHPTIPSLVKTAGYATGAAVSAYVLRGDTGIGAAFDHYDDAMDATEGAVVGELQRAGGGTVAAAEGWVEANRRRPFFFLLHLFEPHAPYAPPEPFRTEYAGREYDGEIAAADSMVGRFVSFLKEKGIYDSAVIVFLSDHGEGLGDHGESQHGIFLYREAIRVPLIVKLPASKRAGQRVSAPVQLIDVLPTIAAIAGVAPPDGPGGRSLLEIADGKWPDRRIFSETMYPRIHLGLADLASLVDATHHYIEAPRAELYALAADPGEKRNVLSDERRVAAAMKREIDGFDRTLAAPTGISAEEAAKLSALGYLSAAVPDGGGALADPKDRIADLEASARAAQLVAAGRAGEALEILRGLVERNPRFADAWSQLGEVYAKSGRPEESIAAYRRAIEVAPMLASDAAVSLAESYLVLRKIDESIEHAKIGLSVHPAAAHAVLARAYLTKGDLGPAESEARWLVDDPSRHVEGLVVMAQLHVAQKRLDDAAGLTRRAREEIAAGAAPVPNLAFVEGDVLARRGRIAEAKRAFREEAEEFPRNREAFVRLAVLQTLEGNLREAERTFQRMAKASPDPSSYALAAETFERLGHPKLAAKWRGHR